VRVEWLPPAQQNLAEIVGYIAADNSVAVAYKVHGEITGQVDHLRDNPYLGRPGRIKRTRELVINRTPYIAAYRIVGEVVQIIRVLHGAQRWPRRF
jgi:addiction module RelE/StbE family toxin